MRATFACIFLIWVQQAHVALSEYNQQSCLFEFNSTFIQEGEISSPNYPNPYPNNLNCVYKFHGHQNELIILRTIDFQLENAQSSAHQEINFMDFIETRQQNERGSI